jgi:RNA polymerase subunit RPABC4/transcription elongation factor Spt4
MPTFKHPCPHCGKYIARDVAACPFCGTSDPFAPARCLNCRTVIEDRAWVRCPRCGHALAGPPTAGQGPASNAGQQAQPAVQPAAAVEPTAAQPAPADASKCSGCGAPLPANARFCTVCGTLAG